LFSHEIVADWKNFTLGKRIPSYWHTVNRQKGENDVLKSETPLSTSEKIY